VARLGIGWSCPVTSSRCLAVSAVCRTSIGQCKIVPPRQARSRFGSLPAKLDSNSDVFLKGALRNLDETATSHTSICTDWRDNEPELEPIVEIFQGARTSAEHGGAPLASSAARTDLWAGSYGPKGFVWLAWEKGYKLGVQASSDHVSTHSSYAMVLSDDYSRQGLVAAMRQRHTLRQRATSSSTTASKPGAASGSKATSSPRRRYRPQPS